MFLQQFNFNIDYKQGSTHTNAEALSRQPSPSVSTATDDLQLPNGSTELIRAQHDDSLLRALHDQGTPMPKTPHGLRHCLVQNGVLC